MAAGFQNTQVIGYVGRDPEMRHTQSGVAVASFNVAVNRSWKDEAGEKHEKVTWFRVSAWRSLAETVNQHVRQGMQIFIEGEIHVSAYTNKDGEASASLELTARNIMFLGSRNQSVDDADDPGFNGRSNRDDIPF